jgi:aminoglycoside phosphotransferase
MLEPVRVVDDPKLPALALLLGPQAAHLLEVLVEPLGGSIRSARIGQVRYVPAKSATVQYEAEVDVGSATSHTTFIATSGVAVSGEVVRLDADGIGIAAWGYPHDPFLPGLASAADPHAAGRLLADLGATSTTVTVRRRAYRAGRRAVVEVRCGPDSIYLKVVRPSQVAALQETHGRMTGQVPVPRSLGWSDELGIIALQALRGRPLRKAIQAGTLDLPSAAALTQLLDRLPSIDRPAAPGPLDRVASHVRLISAIMPELRHRLEAFADEVATVSVEPLQPTHGDFHAGQILVDGTAIVGLVDVDTAGMGQRSDDLARLLAQMSTLAISSPQRDLLDRYGRALITGFDRLVDPVGLRLRVAAAVLGFATGPFRVQTANWPDETDARVALAERWLAFARNMADPR